MSLTDAQKLAFVREMGEILANNSTELTALGYDPASKITELETQGHDAELAEATQQQKAADSVAATMAAKTMRELAYGNASATVDLMSGVLGKTNPVVRKIRKIRSSMNR